MISSKYQPVEADNSIYFPQLTLQVNDENEKDLTDSKIKIDHIQQRYPYCIVWTPLPFLTWLIPLIGHTGICTSDGVIHDFAGPYHISIDNFAFGRPYKYVLLKEDKVKIDKRTWDNGVARSDERFSKEMHNLFSNNCHSHVANALNNMEYKGKNNWNMFDIWILCIAKGKYVSLAHFFGTYLGFIVIIFLIYWWFF